MSLLKDRAERKKHEVVFYTYPSLVFVWPLIIVGLVLWALDCWHWANPVTLAWVWGITLILVVLTMGIDINRNVAIFWLAVIIGLTFLILYLRDVSHVRIFSDIYTFFKDLKPEYSRNLGLMISIVLAVPYLIMLLTTRVNSKWRITNNEFEHIQFGRVDDSLARGAKRVSSNYPDLFEFIICLAGELTIYDSSGNNVLRRIPHVPFLPWVHRKINRLLESTSVTAAQTEDEEHAENSDDAGDRGA